MRQSPPYMVHLLLPGVLFIQGKQRYCDSGVTIHQGTWSIKPQLYYAITWWELHYVNICVFTAYNIICKCTCDVISMSFHYFSHAKKWVFSDCMLLVLFNCLVSIKLICIWIIIYMGYWLQYELTLSLLFQVHSWMWNNFQYVCKGLVNHT